MCDLTAPQFTDEEAARKHIEAIRWPDGPVCVHCGSVERIYPVKARPGRKIRAGLYKCGNKGCGKQFTVTVGTVFEGSHVPLNKWLMAIHLMCASKKGISAHQLHRMLGVQYKTAWFMCHRIREAMKEGGGLLGGSGPVEVDETFWGKDDNYPKKNARATHRLKILTLVERGGKARSYHVPSVRAATLRPILREQIEAAATVYTDNAGQYRRLKEDFPTHETVNHFEGEYVRGPVSTNTVESYFSVLKRGLFGTFHHVSKQHLKRYVCEFDFRYNYRSAAGYTDRDRALVALKGIEGKRLMYRD